MRYLFFIFLLCCTINSYFQGNKSFPLDRTQPDTTRISFWFMGDIMQHKPQIYAAWDTMLNTYNYDTCFHFVSELYALADFSIANLETTFGGYPFTGYPQFSAPDQLAYAIKKSGINVLVTANNHSCDRGKKGITRTIQILDSLSILRTGTFQDSVDFVTHHPLMLEKNGFRIALLNYTYGTNGLPIPKPCIVNLIDTIKIKQDIKKAKELNPDEIITFFHWGNEYERLYNQQQAWLAQYLNNNGIRIIIGSHPHVIQPMHFTQSNEYPSNYSLIVYSLGNFISNQRKLHSDGGAMFYIRLRKINQNVEIEKIGYVLTWVWTPTIQNKKYYFIIPISKYERQPEMFDSVSYAAMMLFAKETRAHLQNNNINVNEIHWCSVNNKWLIE